MIREATPNDCAEIMEYLREANIHEAIQYEPDADKAKTALLRTMAYGFCWVSGSPICGVLAGVIDSPWFSHERFATDLVFRADSHGHALLREFTSWAKSKKVGSLLLGVNSSVSPLRTSQFYDSVGLPATGTLHAKRI